MTFSSSLSILDPVFLALRDRRVSGALFCSAPNAFSKACVIRSEAKFSATLRVSRTGDGLLYRRVNS